ncbi:hypothetical protein [Deinococcus hopiensis]|uniref:Uncharacterized protein n=1 Tax=Deinococcus hopiensis KR-140 TaxID=695939 RepID=A0A1W1VG47_9DEIO|nr:hypothetical protein [Deinococcus hopiensis]SMB91944.1 hypothetical protein SAMN00790413_01371 [Deinococcus hopiensis KR-140]
MPARLNLAALTADELQTLLGAGGAQARWPEVSQARLEGRALPGPALPTTLSFGPLEERVWGATPEQSRLLAAFEAQLHAAGAEPVGVFYSPERRVSPHGRAFVLGPDAAVTLRWSEVAGAPQPVPFVEALTWLRDRASGLACVLSTGVTVVPAPALSEEIDLRPLPGASATELLTAHRAAVLRHGRGNRVVGVEGWIRAWQELRSLNVAAWTRRGLLLPGEEGEG